jgi:hypothetical protein
LRRRVSAKVNNLASRFRGIIAIQWGVPLGEPGGCSYDANLHPSVKVVGKQIGGAVHHFFSHL